MDEGSSRATVVALCANIGIGLTKFLAFALTGSSSMLAEGIHSVADSGNEVLLLVGGRRSGRRPSASHPFGYGRERYLYAFLVAVILFTLGGLFSLYDAWQKFQHPEPITSWRLVPLVVVVIGLVLEGSSLRTAVRASDKRRGARSLLWFIRATKTPELPVVLLEDSAAVVGLVAAGLGVGLTVLTGDGRFDAAGTAVIGLVLAAVAIVLAREMKSLLIGEAAAGADTERIRAALVGPGVDRVIHLRTVHMGPEQILVAAKIAVTATDRAAHVAAAINAAERRVRAAVPMADTIYLEPDIDRGEAPPAPWEQGAPAGDAAGGGHT